MKLRVLVDEEGELIAATSGSIGLPEEMSKTPSKDSEPAAGIIPGPGQSVQEVDVPDELINVDRTEEFHRHVAEVFRR
ncbi:hypothetical protein [Saccharopolyspora shandongensis]|uniref:hypothetical protein n=1 Tax=Saccharopolyspora shandongensis TaxID=418495 RepID=UPI0033E4B281